MAGIGFELRKLTERGDLFGIAQGYAYAALVTAGPWLFTIVALAAVVLLGMPSLTPQELATFRVIVIYNFAFSLVLTGPIAIVTTRYLADCIHAMDTRQAPGVMLGSLALVYALAIPLAGPFYLVYLKLDATVGVAAVLHFLLISAIWVVSVFLTALKNYRAVMLSFLTGMATAAILAPLLALRWSVTGMLAGFDLGLAVILFLLIARVLAEYPTRADQPFQFVRCFRTYWELAVGAFAYNAATWADKWLMWQAPEGETLKSGMISFPAYDSAMFLAYLSIVPAMAAFTLFIETGFYEKYLQFYDEIQRHAPYHRIEENQQALAQSFLDGARNFLILQGSICLVAILLAPQLFEALGISFVQLGIFRLGLLGAFFHGGILFLSIILSYFDMRRMVMWMGLLFLVTNGVFSLVTVRLGFAYYGFGYFLSALVVFGASFVITARLINRLPYQAFVRSNSSIAL